MSMATQATLIPSGQIWEEPAREGIAFVLCCTPTAQQRPRHMRTNSGMDLTYKSRGQVANERTLEALLVPHVPENALDGALELRFAAYMPVPSSVSKKRREAMLRGEIGPTVKPDLDNLAKQLKDAMTRLCFWHDDKQVVRLIGEKKYGESPCWIVQVREIAAAR